MVAAQSQETLLKLLLPEVCESTSFLQGQEWVLKFSKQVRQAQGVLGQLG